MLASDESATYGLQDLVEGRYLSFLIAAAYTDLTKAVEEAAFLGARDTISDARSGGVY